MTWSRLFDEIGARKWVDVINSVALRPPVNIDIADLSLSFEQNLSQELIGDEDRLNKVVSFPGKQMTHVRDTLLAIGKAYHVLACSQDSLRLGRFSWATIDAHHASLLAVRAIVSLAGVVICSHPPGYVLVDAYPESASQRNVKKSRRIDKNALSPIRLLRKKGQLIEQGELWSLLNRILQVVKFTDEKVDKARDLVVMNLGSHRPFRNRIIYDLNSWPFFHDLLSPSSPLTAHSGLVAEEDNSGIPDFNVAEKIFDLLGSMKADFFLHLGMNSPIGTSLFGGDEDVARPYFGSDSFLFKNCFRVVT